MTLQIAGFLEHSTVNGEGLRSVLFVSGCGHACPGCQNAQMQSPHYGESIEVDEIFNRIMKNRPIIDGVTFSGGEPFDQCDALVELAQKLKKESLTLWCYSGYTYSVLKENPKQQALLNIIDVLVDGPFISQCYNENLKYKGSTNQHIYSLDKGTIIGEL